MKRILAQILSVAMILQSTNYAFADVQTGNDYVVSGISQTQDMEDGEDSSQADVEDESGENSSQVDVEDEAVENSSQVDAEDEAVENSNQVDSKDAADENSRQADAEDEVDENSNITQDYSLGLLSLEEQSLLASAVDIILGVEEAPYILSNGSQLFELATFVNSGDVRFNQAYYKVVENISLSNFSSWVPIGSLSNPFYGVFDGDGYTISGLTVSDVGYKGLFAYTSGATIQNCNVVATVDSTANNVDSVVGHASDDCTITNCYAELLSGHDDVDIDDVDTDDDEQASNDPNVATMSVMPIAGSVATINGTGYATLEEAVTAAVTGDTITLLADITLTAALTIGETITIDLDGYDIEQTGTDRVIYVYYGNLTLTDSNGANRTRYGYWDSGTYKIADNVPTSYTGVSTKLDGGIITGGSSDVGGGVHVSAGGSSYFTMEGGNIVGNNSTATGGGGVYLNSSSSFYMNGGTIAGNKSSAHGGGIYMYFIRNLSIQDGSTITDNIANNQGGGIYTVTSTVTMDGGTISNNTAANGGGIYINSYPFNMNGGTIEGNKATTYGGGVYKSGSTFTLSNGNISENTAAKGNHLYLATASTTFTFGTASIKGQISMDDDNYDMTMHTAGSVTIDSTEYTGKSVGDIAYYTGTTWTFDPPSIDLSTQITQPVAGAALATVTTITDTIGTEYSVTITWSPNHTTASYDTVYTGTVTFDGNLPAVTTVTSENAGVNVSGQVVKLVYPATEKNYSDLVSILDAKFYSGQVWDTQRSPVYPNTNSTFRLWNLKSPYDHYLKTFDMSNGEYVKFELVTDGTGVQTLSDLNDNTLTNAFNSYSNSTASGDGVLVREVLYNSNGTEKQVLSDYGLVWALGDEGFLYTAFSGYLKYSGGVGTYVTMDARTSNDTIAYVPTSNDPLSQTQLEDTKVATKDGDTSVPSDTTFDLYGKVVSTDGTTAVGNATVTITYDDYTYTTTTDANGYFVIPDIVYDGSDYEATVQTSGAEVNTYTGILADKSDPIVLKYDSSKAGIGDVLGLYEITIGNSGDGSGTAHSVPSDTVKVIPGESLKVVFGNKVDGYVISSVTGGTKVDDSSSYTIEPTSTTTMTATWTAGTVTDLDLTNYITAPAKDSTPETSFAGDKYSGAITWDPIASTFFGETVYTATITLTAEDGYTFDGVNADSFTYTGATSITNAVGTTTITVTIVFDETNAKDSVLVEDFTFTAPTTQDLVYDGTEKEAKVENSKIIDGVIELTYESTDGTSYGPSTTPPTDAGEYKVTVSVTGDSKYANTTDVTDNSWTFTITQKNISTVTITAIGDKTYTGSEITPDVEVKDDTENLTKDTHYDNVTYANNTSVGIATVTVSGIGNYTGTKSTTFNITKATLDATGFTFTPPAAQDLVYDGNGKEPTVENSKVSDGTIVLTYTGVNGTTYGPSTTAPSDAGEYKVTVSVTGDRNYAAEDLTNDDWILTIEQTTYTDYKGDEAVYTAGTTAYGTSNSLDLSEWYDLAGASLSIDFVTDSDDVLDGEVKLNDANNGLEFNFKNDSGSINKTVEVVITVSSTNFDDFQLTVTLTVSDKSLSPNRYSTSTPKAITLLTYVADDELEEENYNPSTGLAG